MDDKPYIGRLAPSPTGFLHLGHVRTFFAAYQRALQFGGHLLYRDENLDRVRSKPEFCQAAAEDLQWLGIRWHGGIVRQSERLPLYRQAFEQLKTSGCVYRCTCTRRDIALAVSAPHEGEEAIYPGTCRPSNRGALKDAPTHCWRFQVPDGETISFSDNLLGEQSFVAGKDFGDFVIWRNDDIPSYQLAVVVDDASMGITEVVRGRDLLISTARQILLYRALGLEKKIPSFAHCELVRDGDGKRLAKRTDALSVRRLRNQGFSVERILEMSTMGCPLLSERAAHEILNPEVPLK